MSLVRARINFITDNGQLIYKTKSIDNLTPPVIPDAISSEDALDNLDQVSDEITPNEEEE